MGNLAVKLCSIGFNTHKMSKFEAFQLCARSVLRRCCEEKEVVGFCKVECGPLRVIAAVAEGGNEH